MVGGKLQTKKTDAKLWNESIINAKADTNCGNSGDFIDHYVFL